MPNIQTSECDPDRREGGFSLFFSVSHSAHTSIVSLGVPDLYRQAQYNSPKHSGREVRGTAVFYDRDGDKCVIVVKVTGIDSPSVWFEMDGWMESEKEDRASGLVGVKKE